MLFPDLLLKKCGGWVGLGWVTAEAVSCLGLDLFISCTPVQKWVMGNKRVLYLIQFTDLEAGWISA